MATSEHELLEAARGGDEDAYGRLVEPHRAEPHAHCDLAATLVSAPDVPREAGTGSRPRRCSSARGSDLSGVAPAAAGAVAAVCSAGSFPRLGQLC
jgi:hypothetical protein